MWDAISKDDEVAVEILLKNGFDVSSRRTVGGKTLLQHAFENNAKKCFAVLAESQAGIEAELSDGTRIIHLAAYASDGYWLSQLIRSGADVDAWSNGRGNRKGTPIHFAIIEDCQDNGLKLLEAGACIHCSSNQFGSSAFYHAANFFRWKIAAEMLRRGADPFYGAEGKRVVDTLKQLDLNERSSHMAGFGDFVQELAAIGVGREAFRGSIWSGKTYDDYLVEKP